MTQYVFEAMQAAVDVVNTSPHPANKIAATLSGTDRSGAPYTLSRTNFWPPVIAKNLGTETRIGNSSGTIHAETACILAAPRTEGAVIYVTDPFCPNCAKNMAEAGIRAVYIDHKGFDKDFAARRSGDFERMSMQICAHAGISIYKVNRREQTILPILTVPKNFQPVLENPVKIEQGDAIFKACAREKSKDRNFAAAAAKDEAGNVFSMSCPAFDYGADKGGDGKYTFTAEPVNRILMNAGRHGLKIMDGFLYSAQVPTSREQVNLAGAGIRRIAIGDITQARNDHALAALGVMRKSGVLEIV